PGGKRARSRASRGVRAADAPPAYSDQTEGTGAHRDNGDGRRSQMGRLTGHWSRPVGGVGTSKTVTLSREADGWSGAWAGAWSGAGPAAGSGAAGRPAAVPPPGGEMGLAVGLKGVLLTAQQAQQAKRSSPRPSRTAEQQRANAQPRLPPRQPGRSRAVAGP